MLSIGSLIILKYSIYLPDMDDLGTIGLAYSPKIPCNDTLYQLWLTQPSYSSDWENINSCKDYDFPQDTGATDQIMTTRSATATSTSTAAVTAATSGTSSSAGTTGSMGEGNSNGSATVSAAPIQSNGTHRAFSIPFLIGAAPLAMAVIWAFFESSI